MAKINSRANTKPKSVERYRSAFLRLHGRKSMDQIENNFVSCCDRIVAQVGSTGFWRELNRKISEWDAIYRSETGADRLFDGRFEDQGRLCKKSWASTLDKVYRHNVVWNRTWPDPPGNGWVTNDLVFEKFGDVVRTQFICRYIDGVKFLLEKIQDLAVEHSVKAKSELKATAQGYHAGHVDLEFELDLVDLNHHTVRKTVRVELQVTTQLKEVVKQLLHAVYVSKRSELTVAKPPPWQWEYREPSFDANYLGHVVHYIEAQILKVRSSNES